MPGEKKKILFISFGHIGDVVRMTPLFRTLKIHYPASYLVCLLPTIPGEILQYNPFVDRVISLPHEVIRENLKDGISLSSYVHRHCFSLIGALKRMNFDLVINPYAGIGGIIAKLVEPKRILGRCMREWDTFEIIGQHAGQFYKMIADQSIDGVRATTESRLSDRLLKILKDIGLPEETFWRIPEVYLGESQKQFAAVFFKENRIRNTDFLIGIQAGAMLNEKRVWPVERFARLANAISVPGIKIIFFGSPSEKRFLDHNLIPHLTCPYIMAAGKTSLLESAALLSRLDLLVSMDTGPAHIAAAFDVPVIVLIARACGFPYEARPYGEIHSMLIGNEVRDISYEEVLRAVNRYIETFSFSPHKK